MSKTSRVDSEILEWLHAYSGIYYDFSEEFDIIKGYTAFTDTFTWYTVIDSLQDKLDDMMDTFDVFQNMVTPEGITSSIAVMKKAVTQTLISNIADNLKNVLDNLHIDLSSSYNLQTMDDLMDLVQLTRELIDMLSNNTIERIIKDNMFEELDEDNDNKYSDIFELHKNDMTDLYFIIQSIKETETETDED